MLQKSDQHLQQLSFTDRASPQFEIHEHVTSNGGRTFQGVNILGMGVNDTGKFLDIPKVSQGLNPTGRGASTDRHEITRLTAYFVYAIQVVRRGD